MVGLEETIWLPFSADIFETKAEISGLKSVVTDLADRGLVMSFTFVENPLVTEPWTSESVTCLVVRWVFTASENRS